MVQLLQANVIGILSEAFEPYFLMRLILCVFEIYALAKEILIMTLLCDIPVTFN